MQLALWWVCKFWPPSWALSTVQQERVNIHHEPLAAIIPRCQQETKNTLTTRHDKDSGTLWFYPYANCSNANCSKQFQYGHRCSHTPHTISWSSQVALIDISWGCRSRASRHGSIHVPEKLLILFSHGIDPGKPAPTHTRPVVKTRRKPRHITPTREGACVQGVISLPAQPPKCSIHVNSSTKNGHLLGHFSAAIIN